MNKQNIKTYQNLLVHYKKYWGEPKTVFKGEISEARPPAPIFVAKFEPGIYERTWIYATLGLGWLPMTHHDSEKLKSEERVELILYSNIQNEELADKLFDLASYPFFHRTSLRYGHAIAGTSEGIIEGSPLTDILLLPPLNEEKELVLVQIGEFTHIRILWANPIYPSEREYCLEHGSKALVRMFVEKEVDSGDLYRKPVV